MAAPVDSPITQEVASIKAKTTGPDLAPALHELQTDMKNHAGNQADMQQFTQKLQDSGTLPALALEYGKESLTAANQAPVTLDSVKQAQAAAATGGDAYAGLMLGQLVNDWDKNKAPDSGNLTAAQIDVDLKAATKAGADPNATTPPTDGSPPPAAPAPEFTRAIAAKEGPYQAIQAAHPDWKPAQVLDAAHKVKAALGADHVFRQGEQLRMNDDGTVTSRTQDRHNPGNFDETTRKDGKKTEERIGDAKGNWADTKYGDDGKPTGSVEHVVNPDGGFTETTKGADGKPTGSVEHKVNADGSTDDSTKGADGKETSSLHTNADKTSVKIEHPDAANPDNTITTRMDATGTVTGSTEFTKAADGSTDTTDKGADGKPIHSVHTGADGSTATTDYKDGKPVHEVDVNADGSKMDTAMTANPNVYTKNSYDKDGNPTAGETGMPNGNKHTWSVDASGNVTTTDSMGTTLTTQVTDKDGKLTKTEVVKHEGGKIITTTSIPGKPDTVVEAPEPATPPSQ